jgi:hypothetical protein
VSTVHVVVPEGFDDPARPSGGNTFDRRVLDGLAAAGWAVHLHAVRELAEAVAQIPDGAVVLIDGLLASPAPEIVVPAARRLRVVVLVHMPLGSEEERTALSAAAAVVTTSVWSRRALLQRHPLLEDRVHVAVPGVEPAELASGTPTGGAFLSVAAVIPGKGHDILLAALESLSGSRWQCVCVGSLERDSAFVEQLLRRAPDGRVLFTGAQSEEDLARSYDAADVLVHPTRAETYGMVVTEALARGLPVVATEVGGVPEALGRGSDGTRPGLLVPPDDPVALGGALRAWLEDADLRGRLRRAALARRAELTGWNATAAVVADVLVEAAR